MDDFRIGSMIRRLRQERGWRQVDLAERARTSDSAVSRIERGRIGPQSIDALRAVAGALDVRIDLIPRWRGGDLDRLLNRAHSDLHESVARAFGTHWPAWSQAPEVSFAIYGERGVIDIMGWHPGRRALLVVELKTDVVDVNELLSTLDRKRRLARRIASERGWDALTVSAWLIVREGRSNRRRVEAHEAMLSGAFPGNGQQVRRWLRDPIGSVACLSFWSDSRDTTVRRAAGPIRRVRAVDATQAERGSS